MKSNQPEKYDVERPDRKYPPERYEILVKGHIDSLWEGWFEGMTLSQVENGETGIPCTLISGLVADQSALHGLLVKIRDLNLTLLNVRRIKPGKNTAVEVPIDPEYSGDQDK